MSLQSCLARIQQIESAFTPPAPPANAAATDGSGSSTFAGALEQATGGAAAPQGAAASAPVSGNGSAASVQAAANALDAMHLPYLYGGGHETPARATSAGMDCSASVSWVLQHAGFKLPTMTSGDLMHWGDAGPGREVTIYASPSHTFMRIGNRFFGTSGFGHPGSGTGPAWFTVQPSASYLAGFVQRHPPGL